MSFQVAALYHLQSTKFYPAHKTAKRRQGFFPTRDPSTLHNCKQYFWTDPQGKAIHCAYLNALEESFREEIIFQQYLSHMTKTMKLGELGFNVLSRDEPWDFRVGLSTGVTINIEICSFTDRPNFFRTLTAEELLQRHAFYDTIRVGILEKISKLFPNDELNEILKTHTKDGLSRSDSVPNPYYGEGKQMFLSINQDAPLPIIDVLREAIAKKGSKKHIDKAETVLILDNRTTTATLGDFISVIAQLEPLLRWSPFFEIWLYTGYGGGHDQEFEDYLFLPLKLDPEISDLYLTGLTRA